jgi:hypothetical protein
VGSRPFGQEVFRCPCEDSVADVIIGFARFEAEAGGKLAFGETAEFPECNHADLLLDGLFLGEGDRLPRVISEHKSVVLDLHVDVESDMHDPPLPRWYGQGSQSAADLYTEFRHKIKSQASWSIGRSAQGA